MKISDYLKDQWYIYLLHSICALLLCIYLTGIGNSFGETGLILIFWLFILFSSTLYSFVKKKKYFDELDSVLTHLDQKYLLAEIMIKPKNYSGRQYYRALKTAGKSMIEQVTHERTINEEYQDYIEQWIHEIKLPITSAKLICENNQTEVTRKIHSQLARINNCVEQALYYARSNNVEKDYIISQVSLNDIVTNVISANKRYLIDNRVSIGTVNLDINVFTDNKWIEFILQQIIHNAVKYRSDHPQIHFTAEQNEQHINLHIVDNGVGIPESELPRIFQKGFTGSNGRSHSNATGIGLYLCQKLCQKLGIGITAASQLNSYTTITLHFPINSHNNFHNEV